MRYSRYNLVFRDIIRNTCIRSYNSIVTNGHMSCNPGFAGYNNVLANPGASGDTHLGNNQGIIANFNIVRNMDKIVSFHTVSDNRFTKCSPVNGITGTYFNMISNVNIPGMYYFLMGAGILGKTKSI